MSRYDHLDEILTFSDIRNWNINNKDTSLSSEFKKESTDISNDSATFSIATGAIELNTAKGVQEETKEVELGMIKNHV